MARRQKISQMTPKGANLQATDLLEISELSGTGYITKSITGQEIINAGGGGGSQNLQQVTDIGNDTTNGIITTSSFVAFDDISSPDNYSVLSTNCLELGTNSTGEQLFLFGNNIEFVRGGGSIGKFKATNITSPNNVTLEFPNKPTGSYTIATTADIPSGSGTVTSVDLTMPSAFTVTGNPITTSGTLAVAGAGVATQYIRGDGQLANFPTSSGGGASVSYYLNGSVSQGTFGGVAMKEINKTPVIGAGTDFTINADGYIQSFITDANDPNQLEIPGGNWNFETYFSASSPGGTPSFYIELYKWDGATLTLIASNSTNPESITGGTAIDLYLTALAVPQTTLALTDRLAIRIYVTHSGRTIKLHTEDNHLCQVITTFSTGLTALNGLTAQVQNLAVGTSGTNFAISSVGSTHTFNLPTASATNRGALSSADWSTFNGKQNTLDQAGVLSLLGWFKTTVTTNYSVTGTTGETMILPSTQVPTLSNGTIFKINTLRISKGLLSGSTIRAYLSPNSNNLTGALQILSTGSVIVAGTRLATISRVFEIESGNIKGLNASTGVINDNGTSTVVGLDAALPAGTLYLIVTVTNSLSTETTTQELLDISNF